MDPQLIEFIRDRFDAVDAMLKKVSEELETHANLDRAYWKKLDEHEAQLRLVKWLMGIVGSGVALVAGWFIQHK